MQALPFIAVALSAVGTGGQILSGIRQAEAQSLFARREAQSIRQAAEFEERQFRRRASLLMGKQTAIAAASGLDITSGSPLLMELDSIREAELEALNIRRTGRMGESAKLFEARLARRSIPFTIVGGATRFGSSLLGSWSTSGSTASTTPTWT